MMNKVVASCDEAVADIFDGATIAFGGFVGTGYAVNLIEALHRKGTRNITAISTMAAGGLLPLHEAKQVVKMITSFPCSTCRRTCPRFITHLKSSFSPARPGWRFALKEPW